MNITDKSIDSGKAFDWGRTSADYAKFRDIYPEEFYHEEYLLEVPFTRESWHGRMKTCRGVKYWSKTPEFLQYVEEHS